MRIPVALGVLGAAAVALTACSAPGTTTSSGGGGTIVVALASDPGTLDPTLANTLDSRVVFTSFCEKLYDVDDKLNVVPELASALPTVSNNGTTMTIPLRTGLKFNDGTPFDANAVKTTLDRDLTLPGSARAAELKAVKSVEVLNASTVRLTLKYPSSPLVAQLADRAGLVMSPTALTKLGTKFGTAPVCVGAFSFASRITGSQISLVKSKFYYNAANVKAAGVTYKIITDPTTRAANLQSGDVQAAEQLDPTDIPRLKADSSLTIQGVSSIGYEGITINISNAGGVGKPAKSPGTPLSNSPSLREAFEMALDRNGINKAVYDGAQAVDCSPLPLQSQYRPTNTSCTPFNPTQAKQLVAASGVKTPIPVTMMIPANSGDDRLAAVIQSEEDAVGFNLTIKSVDFTASLADGQAGQFDTFLIGWSGRIDPDGNLTGIVTTGGTNNYSGVSDPQLDNLISQSAQSFDTTVRQASYSTVLDRLAQLRPIIYLFHPEYFLGLSKQLTGVTYLADGLPRFITASLNA